MSSTTAEEFFKVTDFILDEDVITILDAQKFLIVMRSLERDEDKSYHLNLRDRGLTMVEFNTFIKYLYIIKERSFDRRCVWLKSWLCMVGPVTYRKFKKSVEYRIQKDSIGEYFI